MNNLFISIWFTLVCCTYGYIFHNFTLGRIKGRTLLSRDRNKFYAFLGLPYAEPPIDDLRFQVSATHITIHYSVLGDVEDEFI